MPSYMSERFSPEFSGNFRKKEKYATHRDFTDMLGGKLGVSDRTIQEGMGKDLQAADARTAGQVTQLARTNMPGSALAGRGLQAQKAVAAQSAAPVAQAASQQRELGTRLAEARRQEILGRLAREGDIKRANTQEWLKAIGSLNASLTGNTADTSSGGAALGSGTGGMLRGGLSAIK
tara:strand:- start:16 stop:546 length:531 start_codon:yes stop_codon:yes gene_type:complete